MLGSIILCIVEQPSWRMWLALLSGLCASAAVSVRKKYMFDDMESKYILFQGRTLNLHWHVRLALTGICERSLVPRAEDKPDFQTHYLGHLKAVQPWSGPAGTQWAAWAAQISHSNIITLDTAHAETSWFPISPGWPAWTSFAL